jgi:Skp family chaperone for outer membrane proteins
MMLARPARALVALTLIASALAYAANGDAITMAYVDTERILQGSLEFKEVDRDARLKIELKEEEGQKMLDDLRKFEEELSVLGEEQRQQRLNEYMRMREDLVDFQEQAREEILDRQSVDLKRVAAKIKKIIEAISREQGITMVFDVKPVLYLDPTRVVDLTDKVVAKLNEDYQKEKERLQRKAPARVQ